MFPGLGNGGYDVETYVLDLVYDDATRLVRGRVTVVAAAKRVLSRFNLDSYGLAVDSVRVGDRVAGYAHDGAELVVTPAASIRPGERFVVTVDYAADPRLVPQPSGGFVATDDGFALATQPAGARTVFPSNDHPSDKAYFLIRVTAPAGKLGVASGTRVARRTHGDGSTTYVYRPRDPMATSNLQVAVGDYAVVNRGVVDGLLRRDVVSPDRRDDVESTLTLARRQIGWLRPYLGRFPLEAYGLLPLDDEDADSFGFTALETQTLTLYTPEFLERDEDEIGSHLMHELVHSWFGNSVTPSDWSALWLSEGHAELYALTYRYARGWSDRQGFTRLAERMRYAYRLGDVWRALLGPVARPDADRLFDDQRYTGGALVLFALRERVGADTFAAIERAFLTRFRNRSAGTEDFIDVATAVSGDRGVRPFLERWLYRTTTPPMPNHPDWVADPVPPLFEALRG